MFSFSHPQKSIPQNYGVISLFGTNMEEMGDKQENKRENVLKLSFLFVNGNNFTATTALNLVLYIKKSPDISNISVISTSAKINSANF